MKFSRITLVLNLIVLVGMGQLEAGSDLKSSKFTRVFNDVSVIDAAGATRKAQVNGSFKMPETIKTGIQSRAELEADDQTIIRVGANTSFSFNQETRGMNLQQGNVLFYSPTGKGGGTVSTAGATAGVTGTTIIVSATSNGGFKLLVLEGTAKVKLPNGRSRSIKAGQMVFILPNATRIPPPITFHLASQVAGSQLVNFSGDSLPSINEIQNEIDEQNQAIAEGKGEVTNQIVGDAKTDDGFEVIDQATLEQNVSGDKALSSSFSTYFFTPATIASGLLDPTRVFTVDFGLGTIDTGVTSTSLNSFQLFPASIINFAGGAVTVDIQNLSDLVILLAVQGQIDLSTATSVTFEGNPSQTLALIESGSAASPGAVASLSFQGKNLFYTSGASKVFEGGSSFSVSGSGTELFISADGNLSFHNTIINPITISATTVSLAATDTLSLGKVGINANTTFSGVTDIRLAANTIILHRVDFGGAKVNFFTSTPGFAFDALGASVVPGKVNFMGTQNLHTGDLTGIPGEIENAAEISALQSAGFFNFGGQ